MKKRFILLTSLLSIIISTQLFGQSYGGISVVTTVPSVGSPLYKYSPGNGISFDLISKDILPDALINFQYGVHTDFMMSDSEDFSSAISGENLDIEIRNQSFGAYFFGRMITKKSLLRIYTDAFIGSRLLYTKLYDDRNDEEDWLTSNMNLFCGVSVGAQARLKEGVYADVSLSQTFGGPARIVDLDSFDPRNNFSTYAIFRTPNLSNMQLQVGLIYEIGWSWLGSSRHEQTRKKQKQTQTPRNKRSNPSGDKPAPAPLPKG